MTFERVWRDEINRERYPLAPQQWRSTGGRWLLTWSPQLYGVRVIFGLADDEYGHDLEYCAGADRHQLFTLTAILTLALERVPESIDLVELRRRFPRQVRKPMSNDPDCWRQICQLAGFDFFPFTSAELPAGQHRGGGAADDRSAGELSAGQRGSAE